MMNYLIINFNTKKITATMNALNTDDKIVSFPFSISYINDTFFNVRLSDTMSKLNKILNNKTIATSLYSNNIFLT